MKEKLFTVLPMSQRFSLEAGHTYTGSITIANPHSATEPFSYTVTAEPFNTFSSSESKSLSDSNSNAYVDLAEWITIDNPTGTLQPNEYHVINFTINVPEGTPAGGQYAALVVSENPELTASDGTANVDNILVLASVIYADVTGITVRDGSILENTIPGFALTPDVTLSAAVENRGNTHSDATILIDVKNALNGDVIISSEESNGKFQEIVLPETIRYINRRIDNLPPLGVFSITQTVYFNDTVSTTEQNVIICPLWFIFAVSFTIILIIAAIIARVRHYRRHKAHLDGEVA